MLFLFLVGIVIGVILIYQNGSALNDLLYLKRHGKRTVAEVIENKEIFENNYSNDDHDDPLKPQFIPILKFQDDSGNKHLFQDFKSKSFEKQKIGKRKEVIYDPADPSFSIVDDENRSSLLILGIIIGVTLFLVSSYFFILNM